MKRYYSLIGLLCCVLACKPAMETEETASNPVYSNSISNNKINSIAEDAQGHIWIGTFRGLNKDAVHEYHQYYCAEDSLSIPDNQVQVVYNDSKDVLWVSTVNGLCRYTDKDNFVRIPAEGIRNKNITQIMEDKKGNLYCFANPFLSRYNPQTGSLELQQTLFGSFNSRIFISPSDEFWFVGGNQVRHYGTTMQLRDSLILNTYPGYSFMTPTGQLWLCSDTEVQIYDTNTRRYLPDSDRINTHPLFNGARVNLIYPYGDNSLLVNTDKNGLFLYDSYNGTIFHQSENGFPFEVPDFIINTIFTDSKDNIWFGSYDQGIAVHYNYKKRFNADNYLCSAFENKSVTAVDCDSKGNLWINTLNNGFYIYYAESKVLQKIDLENILPKTYDRGFIHTFLDSHDKLWVSTINSIVNYSLEKGKLVEQAKYPAYFPFTIGEDNTGCIWIGNYNSVLQYIKNGQVHFIEPFTQNFTFVSAMLPIGKSMLIGSFTEGLFLASSTGQATSPIELSDEDINNCIKRSVFYPSCMFEDSRGLIWIGTVANGLLCYDKDSGALTPVEGTPCMDICSIEEDIQGNLWISTQHGLGKYDRNSSKFINWFDVDGIGGNQFYDHASCRMPDGTLVFGGTHGLTMFNPSELIGKKDVNLIFEKLKVHNVPVVPKAGGMIDKAMPYNPVITMQQRQNSFSIAFSALEYGEYERVHYFYKMEGFDATWIDAGNNREANYANLPAGHYTFKVRVTNNDQSVVEAENSIKIIVKPSILLSWWAILIYALIITAAVVSFVVIRLQTAAEKKAKQKALFEKEQEMRVNKMNMSFFANISHEFRAPLTMISGPVSTLRQNSTGENARLLDIVQRNINRMLRLVNQLLDFNKLENDSLKLKVHKTDIITPLRNLSDIFKVSAEEKGVTFLTYGLEDSLNVYVDEDKLDKICFNLLSNSLKFTPPEGKVEFSLDVLTREGAQDLFILRENDVDTRYVKISVKDNGPGIPKEQLEKIFERYYQLENQTRGTYNWGTGIGLYFAKSLAEMHHGYLKAENRTDIASGAIFTLLLPMSESSYYPSEISNSGESGSQFITAPIKYAPVAPSEDSESGKTIVVVDDDVDVAHYLKELLSSCYKVVCKFDADSAFVAIKEVSPDIVISDVSMPGKTGYDLCSQIKSELQLSHIPVVLLTAKAMMEDQIEGLECGADAYVTKPFDPQYLLSLIGSLLSNREKLRAQLVETTTAENLQNDRLSAQDKAFITELYALMENELSNSELDIATMTKMLHISRSKFYYKVKGLTGENPAAFFKLYKLNRAAELLKEGKYNISEVADITGFSTLSHFSTAFKKHFGKSPSEWDG